MRVIPAEEETKVRFRVVWTREDGSAGGHVRYSREDAERDRDRIFEQIGQPLQWPHSLGSQYATADVLTEDYTVERTYVAIVNNGDGEPRVHGRWFRAERANQWANRHAARYGGRVGAIRVVPLLPAKR